MPYKFLYLCTIIHFCVLVKYDLGISNFCTKIQQLFTFSFFTKPSFFVQKFINTKSFNQASITFNKHTKIHLFRNTNVFLYICIIIDLYKCTVVILFKRTEIQNFKLWLLLSQ